MSAAITRWTAFLAQIQQRHGEVRAEVEAQARRFIASVAAGGDVQPLSHQLMAARSRLLDLEARIIDTWHAQAEQAILDAGHSVAERDREYETGQSLQWSLEDHREELEPRLFAELARQRHAHARAAVTGATCRRCGTAYPGPVAFRAVEATCYACGGGLRIEPGELMRSVAAVGAHAIAQEAAVTPWRAMRAAERRAHRMRPPRPLDVIVELERAQIAYWYAYLATRAQFEPELGRDPVFEIRSRMEAWYVGHAEYEPAWVQAGRPRSI